MLELKLILVMGRARIAGVVGVVELGSTVESVKIIIIEILIKVLNVIATIKGNVKQACLYGLLFDC